MNILVIGPGDNPEKFGKGFCDLASVDEHTVFTISHGNKNVTIDSTNVIANFNDLNSLSEAFDTVTKDIDHLDILLYNSNYPGTFLNEKDMFNENSTVPVDGYNGSLQVQVICPHFLAIKSLSKMTDGSKIIFMTTGLTYGIWETENDERFEFVHHVGYIGSKSYQNALMLGLAMHNNKNVIVASISPHFPYDDPEQFNIVLGQTYRRILKVSSEDNGSVIRFNDKLHRLNF